MTNKLRNPPARAARRLRATVIGLLGLSGIMAVQLPVHALGIPSNWSALRPSDLSQHYKIPTQYTGKGQTIVILTGYLSATFKTTTARAALNAYSVYFKLPQCSANVANSCFDIVEMQPAATGGPSTSDPQDIVERSQRYRTLDIELAHSIAPAARIVLLSAPSGTDQAALNQKILDLKPTVVVIGKIGLEFPGQTSTETNCLCDGFFAAHPEIAFVSGTSDLNGVTYPATSPYVTAVGRTKWAPYNDFDVEAANEYGHGFSSYAPMPEFQRKYLADAGSPLLSQSNNKRAIPDVAYQASVIHVAYHTGGIIEGLGLEPITYAAGEPAAASQWAGIVALLGEAVQAQGYSLAELLRAHGGLNKLLYRADVAKTFNHLGTPAFNAQVGLGAPADVTKLITAVSTPLPLVGNIIQGTTLRPGMSIVSPNGNYVLKMQSDGNLVQYNVQTGSSMWHTSTYGNPGAYAKLEANKLAIYNASGQALKSILTKVNFSNTRLSVQDDGNVVIYRINSYVSNQKGQPSSTSGDPLVPFPLTTSVWRPGVTLNGGDYIDSQNGKHRLIMQADGNLVLYQNIQGPQGTGAVGWHAGTYGNNGAYATMKSDGTMAIYTKDNRVLLTDGASGNPDASIVVTNDGVAQLVGWQPNWSSWYGVP